MVELPILEEEPYPLTGNLSEIAATEEDIRRGNALGAAIDPGDDQDNGGF